GPPRPGAARGAWLLEQRRSGDHRLARRSLHPQPAAVLRQPPLDPRRRRAMDYDVGRVEKLVASPYRGGALVEFDVHRVQSVTGALEFPGGGAPAFGELQLSAAGKQLASPISAEGRFWLDGVPVGTHVAAVEFRG